MKNKMNKIHNVDCLEFMREVPDNYFDLVLTDPPYGLGLAKMSGGGGRFQYDKKDWDSTIPTDSVFKEIFRISKNQIIWGGNYFNLPANKNFIIWDKKQSNDVNFAMCEYAWTSIDFPAKLYSFSVSRMNKLHPTQKPIELIEYCIDFSQRRNKTTRIFDPFMGSGTTAVACKSLGLDWCGCELEEDYCNIARKRLQAVQGSLL